MVCWIIFSEVLSSADVASSKKRNESSGAEKQLSKGQALKFRSHINLYRGRPTVGPLWDEHCLDDENWLRRPRYVGNPSDLPRGGKRKKPFMSPGHLPSDDRKRKSIYRQRGTDSRSSGADTEVALTTAHEAVK